MRTEGTDTLVDAVRLAQMLGVKPGTIRQWSRQGRIPRIELSQKVVRFDPQEVIGSLRRRSRKGVVDGPGS